MTSSPLKDGWNKIIPVIWWGQFCPKCLTVGENSRKLSNWNSNISLNRALGHCIRNQHRITEYKLEAGKILSLQVLTGWRILKRRVKDKDEFNSER